LNEPTYLHQKLHTLFQSESTLVRDNCLSLLSYQLSPESGLVEAILENLNSENDPTRSLQVLKLDQNNLKDF
jgi:hypothetical protein